MKSCQYCNSEMHETYIRTKRLVPAGAADLDFEDVTPGWKCPRCGTEQFFNFTDRCAQCGQGGLPQHWLDAIAQYRPEVRSVRRLITPYNHDQTLCAECCRCDFCTQPLGVGPYFHELVSPLQDNYHYLHAACMARRSEVWAQAGRCTACGKKLGLWERRFKSRCKPHVNGERAAVIDSDGRNFANARRQ